KSEIPNPKSPSLGCASRLYGFLLCASRQNGSFEMYSEFLTISPRIAVLPVIHGSGDCAVEVRRVMLDQTFDCLAVPLPPSFQRDVERAIGHLPAITVVTQAEPNRFLSTDWDPDRDSA